MFWPVCSRTLFCFVIFSINIEVFLGSSESGAGFLSFNRSHIWIIVCCCHFTFFITSKYWSASHRILRSCLIFLWLSVSLYDKMKNIVRSHDDQKYKVHVWLRKGIGVYSYRIDLRKIVAISGRIVIVLPRKTLNILRDLTKSSLAHHLCVELCDLQLLRSLVHWTKVKTLIISSLEWVRRLQVVWNAICHCLIY